MEFPVFSSSIKSFCLDLEEPSSLDILNNLKVPDHLEKAAVSRQQDYLGGRYCASKALEAMGIANDGWLATNEDRSPQWPISYVGSISHTKTFVIAVTASKKDISGIGVDVESLRDATLRISDKTLTEFEHSKWLASSHSMTSLELATLIFSAKEAIFKAIYPIVKKYFWFEAAQIINIDFSNNSFIYELLVDLDETFTKGYRGIGTYQWYKKLLVSSVQIQ